MIAKEELYVEKTIMYLIEADAYTDEFSGWIEQAERNGEPIETMVHVYNEVLGAMWEVLDQFIRYLTKKEDTEQVRDHAYAIIRKYHNDIPTVISQLKKIQ